MQRKTAAFERLLPSAAYRLASALKERFRCIRRALTESRLFVTARSEGQSFTICAICQERRPKSPKKFKSKNGADIRFRFLFTFQKQEPIKPSFFYCAAFYLCVKNFIVFYYLYSGIVVNKTPLKRSLFLAGAIVKSTFFVYIAFFLKINLFRKIRFQYLNIHAPF